MKTTISQLISCASFHSDWKKFVKGSWDLKSAQSQILDQTLAQHPFISSRADFLNLPPQDYHSLSERLNQWKPKDFLRYQPTSGSGEKEKVIPYTQRMVNQFQQALNPWLFDLYTHHPRVLKGRHYWSLSWLPTHWREKGWVLDDTQLLPAWKRSFLSTMMAAPLDTANVKTLPSCQFATLTYLVYHQDLSFISVWSPTFFLELLKLLDTWKPEIEKSLRTGSWSLFAEDLSLLPCPQSRKRADLLKNFDGDYHALWPLLALVSAWESSTAQMWARLLKSKFPKVAFSAKGLWATEGVVTIPFRNEHTLSYLSHYYEFQDLKTKEILPAHELQLGMEVYPLITTPNGFVRYCLEDRVKVSGFFNQVPNLEFLGRDGSFDLTGEKMSSVGIRGLILKLQSEFSDLLFVCAFAMGDPKRGKPYYLFLFEGEKVHPELKTRLTSLLHEHFHYQLAKELGQLGDEVIKVMTDGLARYHAFHTQRGMVAGNIKAEVARTIIHQKESDLLYDCLA